MGLFACAVAPREGWRNARGMSHLAEAFVIAGVLLIHWRLGALQGQIEALRKRIEKGAPLTEAEEEGAPLTRSASTGPTAP